MTLASKLSTRWARIYGQPIDKLACLQADFVNIAYAINPTNYEDYVMRRTFLKISKATLQALENRIMGVVNPSQKKFRYIQKNSYDDIENLIFNRDVNDEFKNLVIISEEKLDLE